MGAGDALPLTISGDPTPPLHLLPRQENLSGADKL